MTLVTPSRFLATSSKLLIALCATTALYAGFAGSAMAAQAVVARSIDDSEPTIEINYDALDALNRQDFQENNLGGWHKGPEGHIQHPHHTTKKAKKPKPHPKPKAAPKPAEETAAAPAEKPLTKKEKAAAAKAEKEKKAADAKAAKDAAKAEKAKADADAKAAKQAAAAPKPVEAPPALPDIAPPPPAPPAPDDAAIKKAASAPPELSPTAPPAPPAPAVELPAPPPAPAPSASDLSITPMPAAPAPAGEFASGLNAPAPAKEVALDTAKAPAPPAPTAEIAPPAPPPPAPAPEAKTDSALPSTSMLSGSKKDDAAPAADSKLPSPQAVLDKLDSPEAQKDAKSADSSTADDTSKSPPTLRVIFLSTETSVPLSVHADLDKVVASLKDNTQRVTLVAYASGAGDQATTARRVSLSRALSVRAYLIDKGVGNLRINVQAEGNKNAGTDADRVDVFVSAK